MALDVGWENRDGRKSERWTLLLVRFGIKGEYDGHASWSKSSWFGLRVACLIRILFTEKA